MELIKLEKHATFLMTTTRDSSSVSWGLYGIDTHLCVCKTHKGEVEVTLGLFPLLLILN